MTRLVALENVSVRYGAICALDCINLLIKSGEVLVIIGESGSGKSTLALALAGLLPKDASLSGQMDWQGEPPRAGRDIGFVFQDPAASLDPLMHIGAQLVEVIRSHAKLSRSEAERRAIALIERVRIPEPEKAFRRYPHQFSGGQKQRIAIAIAIAANPHLLIADEPTSALDTIVQKQIMELLAGLVREKAMTLIFITHDIALAGSIADNMAVFRHGRLIEAGRAAQILTTPQNDYTRALIAAVPRLERSDG